MSGKSNARGRAARAQHQAAHNGRSAMEHLADDARQALHEARDAAMDSAARWEESLEERIRQQPLKSVLIAAGVGIVLGVLLRR